MVGYSNLQFMQQVTISGWGCGYNNKQRMYYTFFENEVIIKLQRKNIYIITRLKTVHLVNGAFSPAYKNNEIHIP